MLLATDLGESDLLSELRYWMIFSRETVIGDR